MTILYEVHTSHTKKLLKAFATLYTNRFGFKKTYRFLILAVIFVTLPKAMNAPREGYMICWGFAAFVLLLAFARKYITYACLLLQDKYYRQAIPITMQFGSSKFTVKDDNEITYRYTFIEELYADNEFLYFHMEGGDLFLIPKTDFVKGDPIEFYDYMQRTTGKEFGPVNLNFKQKIMKIRMDMHRAEIEHDQKVEKRKNKKK